jgi:hypothetical protein
MGVHSSRDSSGNHPEETKTMTKTKTPRETDTELAAIWGEIYKAQQQLSYAHSSLLSAAGAKYSYRGRQRVPNMTLEEALAKVTERAAYVKAYKAEHAKTETDGWQTTDWTDYVGAPWEADDYAEALTKLAKAEAVLTELHAKAEAVEATYTGWSRFFLVTSSAGHVHSSTHCSTCRPTTTYGWLPELSGKTEAKAVKDLGPTLCSVCFPSAPTAWTTGKKITAAQAAKKAAA